MFRSFPLVPRFPKSGRATLGHWYSTARVSKRLTDEAAACLRARYCTNPAVNLNPTHVPVASDNTRSPYGQIAGRQTGDSRGGD